MLVPQGKSFFLNKFFPFLCLCPSPHYRPGDPQSAQDKARMDKEYLSLMAELGEAPVPASVGSTSGPATTPLASAPRPAAPANNPPPPVSLGAGSLGLASPFSTAETGSYGHVVWLEPIDGCEWQHCSSGISGQFGDFSLWEDLVTVFWSCGITRRTMLPLGGTGRDVGGKCSHVVSHVYHPEPPTLDEFWPFRESALPWHAWRWSWWARRWPPQLPTPITQPDRWAWWTSHAAQPQWTPTPLDAATTTTDEPGPPPSWAPWPSSNG